MYRNRNDCKQWCILCIFIRKNDYLCCMKNIAFHRNNSGAALVGLALFVVCNFLTQNRIPSAMFRSVEKCMAFTHPAFRKECNQNK